MPKTRNAIPKCANIAPKRKLKKDLILFKDLLFITTSKIFPETIQANNKHAISDQVLKLPNRKYRRVLITISTVRVSITSLFKKLKSLVPLQPKNRPMPCKKPKPIAKGRIKTLKYGGPTETCSPLV